MSIIGDIIRRSKKLSDEVRKEDFETTLRPITAEELQKKMLQGVVHFQYLKKDGKTVRDAVGTKVMSLVTQFSKQPNGGDCPPKRAGYTIYYDLGVEGWRAYLDGNVQGIYGDVKDPTDYDID